MKQLVHDHAPAPAVPNYRTRSFPLMAIARTHKYLATLTLTIPHGCQWGGVDSIGVGNQETYKMKHDSLATLHCA